MRDEQQTQTPLLVLFYETEAHKTSLDVSGESSNKPQHLQHLPRHPWRALMS